MPIVIEPESGIPFPFDTNPEEIEQFKAKQAVKILTLPSEMGELFKVLALSKELDIDLNGFLLLDKRASL